MNLDEILEINKGLSSEKPDFYEFIKSTKGWGYRPRALKWFQINVGKIVTSDELKRIPGQDEEPISHNMRRITELRDEQGYDIVNEKDNEVTGLNLKIGEYVLLKNDPDPEKIRERGVNKRIRSEVLTRDNSICQMCGRTVGDEDPFKLGHSVTLHAGHIEAHKRKNGEKVDQRELTSEDFITMCNVCNECLKNEDFKIITMSDKVKNLNKKERKDIYNLLKDEFG